MPETPWSQNCGSATCWLSDLGQVIQCLQLLVTDTSQSWWAARDGDLWVTSLVPILSGGYSGSRHEMKQVTSGSFLLSKATQLVCLLTVPHKVKEQKALETKGSTMLLARRVRGIKDSHTFLVLLTSSSKKNANMSFKLPYLSRQGRFCTKNM